MGIHEGWRECTSFWLDAHYSGGITARASADTPLLARDANHPSESRLLLDSGEAWNVDLDDNMISITPLP
jgi:hypothetical protein